MMIGRLAEKEPALRGKPRRLLALCAAALFALSVQDRGASGTTPPLTGSAPVIMDGLIARWIAAAHERGIDLAVGRPLGPPQGSLDPHLEAVLEGKGDFAFLTREIAERDLETYRLHHEGHDPIVIPVAAGAWNRLGYVDAVAIIVNRANPVSHLSFQALDSIFSRSRLRGGPETTKWGQLGLKGEWASRTIAIMGGGAWRGEESARALTMRRTVLSLPGRRGSWRDSPNGGGESDVVQRVGQDMSAIGFTGMGHLSADVRAVPVAKGAAVAVMPSARSTADGSYPLARTVDLLMATDATGRPSPRTVRFARFLLGTRGQATIEDQGDFAPLPRRGRLLAIQAIGRE